MRTLSAQKEANASSSSILDATSNHSTRRSVTRVSIGGCWVSVGRVRSFYRSAGSYPRKGQDMVIRALPKLLKRYPDLVYLIVGDGRYRQTLETLVGQAGVGDTVVLTGEVRDVPLQQIYALCDLFVMPSREQLDQCDVEGFGMVYLEANACGKAVIGGRSGGIADAIIDGQNRPPRGSSFTRSDCGSVGQVAVQPNPRVAYGGSRTGPDNPRVHVDPSCRAHPGHPLHAHRGPLARLA